MVTVVATADAAQQLETLYRQDGDRLWRALLAFGGDPDIASDAVAEAFAQALRRGTALVNPQGWIWRTGFRIAAGELKKKRAATSAIPEVGYLDIGVDHELLEALAQLPERQRAALVLFYYLDASVRDIAQRTGSSQLAVRASLSRGRTRLKRILGDRNE